MARGDDPAGAARAVTSRLTRPSKAAAFEVELEIFYGLRPIGTGLVSSEAALHDGESVWRTRERRSVKWGRVQYEIINDALLHWNLCLIKLTHENMLFHGGPRKIVVASGEGGFRVNQWLRSTDTFSPFA